MNTKKSKDKKKSKEGLPPLIPPEVKEHMKKEVEAAFGFSREGEFTVSLEFGIEDSELFQKAYNIIKDKDSLQKINRRGIECYYVTYNPNQFNQMITLYDIMGNLKYNEVYINHRRIPYSRSLWLPLFRMISGA
jgi:hypothetical protein